MASVRPSFPDDEIADLIDQLIDTFDFTRPGRDGSDVGRNLADQAIMGEKGSTAVDGIAKRCALALDPDGDPWQKNAKEWREYKISRYDVYQPGELGGQMLSELSLKGKITVAPGFVTMTYGTDTTPRGTARNGVPLKPWEMKATDRQKAEWFEASGRRFYEFDATIEAGVIGLCEELVEEYIVQAGF